ncbi:hypothetical protein [Ferrimonas balearica]|uniref:hypothetical protein n=1 Tax=Ferrimonas balearica TaxID=44012 RepID=UPI001C998ED2|nr:hypothetical protein [Ferrimonas balearica]MBY5992254.1 hypothetical protein [Ferrimonas balearica]
MKIKCVVLTSAVIAFSAVAETPMSREADRPYVSANQYQGAELNAQQQVMRDLGVVVEGRQGDRAVLAKHVLLDPKPFDQQVIEAKARGDYKGSQ